MINAFILNWNVKVTNWKLSGKKKKLNYILFYSFLCVMKQWLTVSFLIIIL